MTASSQQHSAVIYNFAARARVRAERSGQTHDPTVPTAQALPRVDFGGSWYHEAAIQAERQRKP